MNVLDFFPKERIKRPTQSIDELRRTLILRICEMVYNKNK